MNSTLNSSEWVLYVSFQSRIRALLFLALLALLKPQTSSSGVGNLREEAHDTEEPTLPLLNCLIGFVERTTSKISLLCIGVFVNLSILGYATKNTHVLILGVTGAVISSLFSVAVIMHCIKDRLLLIESSPEITII